MFSILQAYLNLKTSPLANISNRMFFILTSAWFFVLLFFTAEVNNITWLAPVTVMFLPFTIIAVSSSMPIHGYEGYSASTDSKRLYRLLAIKC